MSKAVAIYRRELAYFFNSPVAYVVITVFALVAGYFFYNLLAIYNRLVLQLMQNPGAAQSGLNMTTSVVQPLFGNLSTILLIILPLVTMRLLSEERRTGTAELLFTFPISDWDAILGKYFAALTVYAVMLATTLMFPALLSRFGNPEAGPILTSYLGLLFVGASYLAMGLFFSSLSDNQLVAGVATFGCGLLFLLIGWIQPFVSTSMATIIGQLSLLEHFGDFSRGIINTNDIVYYLNVIALFLFLAARVLDSNRWRG